MKKEDILNLQKLLNFHGIKKLKEDGIFGPQTKEGLIRLQKIFYLDPDGIYGPKSKSLALELMSIRYFRLGEFACKCCGQIRLRIELLIKLDRLRDLSGPIIINSGYRCPSHNKRVGGVRTSYHLSGRAADIRGRDMDLDLIYQRARLIFSQGGIGRYRNFLHLDIRDQPATW